jgi:Trk K+ transport system NAD-binding subunit
MPVDRFLVCGLGSLGQHCVSALKEFGVSVVAIEQSQPLSWELSETSDRLDELIIGDCRQKSVLEQAGIDRCRAVLLVTSDERVNATTALIVRQLNPRTRLVVRSAKDNLNELLSDRLGNFIAYEPSQLPAAAFALAALGTDTLSFFSLDAQKLQVIQRQIVQDDPLLDRSLADFNTPTRRLLAHVPPNEPLIGGFYQWSSEERLQVGDTIVYLETAYRALARTAVENRWQKPIEFWQQFYKEFRQFWQLSVQQQIRRVAVMSGFIVVLLLAFGTFLFHLYAPKASLLSSFSGTAILLLGGYGDVFGGSNFEDLNEIPWWMQIFSLILTLAGTAFVGVLYALLTETLLSSKFQFIRNRPPIPTQDHVVIVGLGRVGQQVANLLLEMKQAIVGITLNTDFDPTLLPKMPLLNGNLQESLAKAHIDKAKSVTIVTDDEILNLEVALMTRKLNPDSYLVIRTKGGDTLGQQLTRLLPRSHVLGTDSVAAEAFTGAAFGENILHLFRLNQQTILVTEYEVEAGDTLNGSSIGDIAYGYRVVPILYQRRLEASKLMPEDYLMLRVGDRVVVLATTNGLQRVEQGRRTPKSWCVRVEKTFNLAIAEAAPTVITRFSNCSPKIARDLMENLPATLAVPLYEHQARRLVSELKRIQVQAGVVSIERKVGNT